MSIKERNSRFLSDNETLPTIHPAATVINSFITGDVVVEKDVIILNAVIRADEGTPFYISKGTNIQDFVTLHAYFTHQNGVKIDSKFVNVKGKGQFAIFIGENVSVSHGVLVHGPVLIGNNTFVGFKSTVESAIVGKNVEIGAHSYIANVTIPDDVSLAPGAIICKNSDIEQYIVPRKEINSKIVGVNLELIGYYKNNK